MEWKTVKLGEVCDIRRGASPRPIQEFLSSQGMPWIKISDATATDSKYIDKTKEFIIEEGVSHSVLIEPGTLIVSNSATPGLPKISRITACVHDGWLVIDNFRGILKDFLYYKFIEIRSILGNQANGSVFMNLKTDIVKEFLIHIPDIEKQRKIVSILSSLEDKIENNNRINRNLEAQAQALFKSWFVDFEPWGGSMPEDWTEDSLTNIADFLNGLAMQKFSAKDIENSLPVLKIKELGQKHCDESSDRCTKEIKPEYIIHDGDVIFSWSGTLLVDIWCGGDCGLNQHLFKVSSNKYPKWFYYLWTIQHLQKFKRIASDKAVTMGHIKRGDLDKSIVLIPNDNVLEKMTAIMTPLLDSIVSNAQESARLAALRDTLLPKLMKGEITL